MSRSLNVSGVIEPSAMTPIVLSPLYNGMKSACAMPPSLSRGMKSKAPLSSVPRSSSMELCLSAVSHDDSSHVPILPMCPWSSPSPVSRTITDGFPRAFARAIMPASASLTSAVT